MTKHTIGIEIDKAELSAYTDEYLAVCWHVAQQNPAEHGDRVAGELVEHIGREIIRRWLGTTTPELWHHQGRHHYQRALSRFAKYERGEHDFYEGSWVPDFTKPGYEGTDAHIPAEDGAR